MRFFLHLILTCLVMQMDTDSLGEVCGNLDKVLSSANEILRRFYLSREVLVSSAFPICLLILG